MKLSFTGCYPCMDSKDPIQVYVFPTRKAINPTAGTAVFIEVQVREKWVYRTKSGLLLNHLHLSSPSQVGQPYEYLLNWRLLQIDFDDLLAKDVFRNCCDVNTLSSMYISTTRNNTSRFLNFFKGRVSSICNKKAAKIIETKPKHVVIVTRITTVCLYDLDDDCEAVHSLQVCGKSCIRQETPYGATRLVKDAFLFSAAHGSLAYTDFCPEIHRQTCAVCLNELLVGTEDVILILCDHAFHSRCLIPWFNKVGTCPVCRCITKNYATRKDETPVASPPGAEPVECMGMQPPSTADSQA